jgi:hypothetical protein
MQSEVLTKLTNTVNALTVAVSELKENLNVEESEE